MHRTVRHVLQGNVFYTILVIGFLYTLHAALPVYIASSFLGQYMSEAMVGLVYTIGAVVTTIAFLIMNRVLSRFGNRHTTSWLIFIQILLFAGIIFTDSSAMLAFFFIVQTAIVSMIGFDMDVFIETYSDTRHIGGIRGMYLTVINIAWILAPLMGGLIIDGTDDYRRIFMVAFGILFLLLYLVKKNFTTFHDPNYPHISVRKTLLHVFRTPDLTKVFIANIILQTFYAWMVVYTPIYLNKTLGFSWDQIGLIFTIMLLPFIIFQLPLGKLADRRWGEKEIMSVGFALLGISTYALAFLSSAGVLVWAAALFVTRIGAAAAEIMIETYFFKKVPARESNVLGAFRVTRPIAYVIAPLITAIGLFYTDFSNLFIILGIIVMSALFFTLTIKDTDRN